MSAIFSAKKQLDNAMNDSKVAKVQQARQAYPCPLLAASPVFSAILGVQKRLPTVPGLHGS